MFLKMTLWTGYYSYHSTLCNRRTRILLGFYTFYFMDCMARRVFKPP